MKNTLVVVNPKSGKAEARLFLFDLLRKLSGTGRAVEVLFIGDEKIEDRLNGKDEVICCGGDGTFNSTVNAIIVAHKENEISVGYIPCGSTNDFARSVGIPLTVKNAIKAAVRGNSKKIDVGCWNGHRMFSYVASFGAFSKVSYATPQSMKNNLGHFAYILNGITALGDIKDMGVSVKTENESFSGSYCFGAVLNSTSLAGLVKLDRIGVDMCDGLFEVMLIEKPKNIIELNDLVGSLTMSTFTSPLIKIFKCKACEFEFGDAPDWSLDGEEQKGSKLVKINNMHNKILLSF